MTKEGILGGYIHGNEPSHHIPYLYMWTSQPWKTSENIYKIIDKMYNTRIDGLCGNDDCGQMSAWYIFTALGFILYVQVLMNISSDYLRFNRLKYP